MLNNADLVHTDLVTRANILALIETVVATTECDEMSDHIGAIALNESSSRQDAVSQLVNSEIEKRVARG